MSVTDRRDVIDVLAGDHRAVEDLFQQLETGASGMAGTRKSLVDAVALELAWHCTAAQRYLLPLARRALPDGEALADEHTAEHLTVEHMVRDLEDKDPSDARFEPLLAQLIAAARGHIEHEEQITFAELTRECDRGELLAAGEELTAARRRAATTEPGPNAQAGPVGHVGPVGPGGPAGSGPSVVDRVRAVLSDS
ncbi:hemerythrin domain-containing protein [Catenulispora sp. NF23]|uniref:Hemerythrin domain-containing protein n=1 Tax=Catenulispora pinistramenti TaxID=2705254 RepID=A0ABS5L6N8_9ACTN|nr:hemerythrin domain-containing protein [Catenulispora pinistramenti]MBS2538795.1 hemerythrin domain-containing protein [Catenulispora pinistramenti]MBS2553907.1 hemerythrin domain-containing protein [Catenulispora pinistramenti]